MKNLTAVLSLFVSIIAVFFATWQGSKQIEFNSKTLEHNEQLMLQQIAHDQLTAEPRLSSYFSHHDENQETNWGIFLVNNGLGTAFIKDFQFYVDDEVVPELSPKLGGQQMTSIIKLGLDYNCFLIGRLKVDHSLPINETTFLIKQHPNPESKKCAGSNLNLMFTDRLSYHIIFESIYGVRYKFSYPENTQIRLEN